MSDTFTSRWLALLLLAPTLAILNLLIFPKRPLASPLPSPPPTAGGTWQLLEEQPSRRDRDLDLSPSRTYVLKGAHLGQAPISGLQLNLTSLAVRSTPRFQVATVTATIPSLKLNNRRLIPIAEDGQLAIGLSADHPAWQTCLLPNGIPAVTGSALRRFRLAKGQLDNTVPAKVSRWIGIQDQPGHQCLLVTIRADGQATPADAASLQPFVKNVIQALATKG